MADPFSNPDLRPLPPEVKSLLLRTSASPRLIAHLVLVHDVASRLAERLSQTFPGVSFDKDAVLFGAATHDIGKALSTTELVQPGKKHERRGVHLLLYLGVDENRARFSYTHGNWAAVEGVTLEDLLVALADTCWKGKRVDELEARTVDLLSHASGRPEWDCFADLDGILTSLAAGADSRLAWQQEFRTDSTDSQNDSSESTQSIAEVTPKDVERIIGRDFPVDQYSVVMKILGDYGTEKWHRFRTDVQLAALKLADGNLDRLRSLMASARRDFRDVLYPSNFPSLKKAQANFLGLSPEEQSRIRDNDRQQYEEWLNRPT